MPAVIDPNVCDRNWAACFPARICPASAFSFDEAVNEVRIDDSLCGTCPGPCVNFCDQYAIRYLPDPTEFEVLKAKTLGELDEQAAAEKLEEIRKQAEEKKKQEEATQEIVVTVTTDTFEQTVLDSDLPVIVDFWAPWCGPCRVLGPVLEKLAEEAGGQWSLVKINTDENPALSEQEGIRGIPAVKLYVDGAPVAEFTGALPEPVVRRWLDEYLPSEARQLVEDARGLIRIGQREEAKRLLERLLEIDRGSEEGRALLARLVALEDVGRARALLEGLGHLAEAEAIRDLDTFVRLAEDASGLPDGPGRDEYVAAARDLDEGNVEAATDKLMAVLQRDRYFDDDGPRRVLVALFLLLGETDPITKKHRPTFNRSLY